MRILLQDATTAEFLLLDGRTKSATEAYDFGSTLAALQFSQRQAGTDLQILMKFDRDEFDMTLPVSGPRITPALERP